MQVYHNGNWFADAANFEEAESIINGNYHLGGQWHIEN